MYYTEIEVYCDCLLGLYGFLNSNPGKPGTTSRIVRLLK